MQKIPLNKIAEFKEQLLAYFAEEEADLCCRIRGGILTDEDREMIKNTAITFQKQYLENLARNK